MRHVRQIYIYAMLLIAFAIALFPMGSHLEMCSNKEGHCHITLNFCGVDVYSQTTLENYTSSDDHTACNSSAMFHNTEILSIFSTNYTTNLLNASNIALLTSEQNINTNFVKDILKNYSDYSPLNSPQIIRTTILII